MKENMTLQDCIDLYEQKGQAVICNDGKLMGFIKETENRKVLPPASKQD